MSQIDILRGKRAAAYQEARAILDRAKSAGRELTTAEDRRYNEQLADVDLFDQRIGDLAETETRERDIGAAFAGMGTATQWGDSRRETKGAIRAFFAGELRTLDLSFAGLAEQRALGVGTSTAGGNSVQTSFVGRLYEHMIQSSGVLRANPTMFNTSGGENLQIPKTTAHSGAALTAEAAAIAESDPAFGQVTLGAYKYGNLIKVSRELVDDSSVDLEGYLARQAGRAVGNAMGVHLVTGTGTGQPQGIVTGSTVGVTGGTTVAGVFTADELIDLYFAVVPEYRQNGVWMLNDSTLAKVRKLKDADNNYLFTANNAGGPDLLLGRPIVTDPNFAAVGLGAKSVVFGDPSAYAVRLAGGIRFERSDDAYFGTDQVGFRCLVRGDGRYIDSTGALKAFQGGAT